MTDQILIFLMQLKSSNRKCALDINWYLITITSYSKLLFYFQYTSSRISEHNMYSAAKQVHVTRFKLLASNLWTKRREFRV